MYFFFDVINKDIKMYSITDYKKLFKIDMYLNKKIFKVGYSFKVKNPFYVWYKLSKNKLNKKGISIRLSFNEDYSIPSEYRSKNSDYYKSGYDKGHMASDASFDYDINTLSKTYLLSNVVPQKPNFNRKGWLKAERYSRIVTKKLKYLYVFNIILYGDNYIGNKVYVPTTIYKILINKKNKFLKIFKFNQTDDDTKIKDNIITYQQLIQEVKDNKYIK